MSSKQIIGAVVVLLVAGMGNVAQATFVETWDGAEWSSGNQIATNNGWEDQGNSAGWVHDGEGYLGTRGATSDNTTLSGKAQDRSQAFKNFTGGTFLNPDSQVGTGIVTLTAQFNLDGEWAEIGLYRGGGSGQSRYVKVRLNGTTGGDQMFWTSDDQGVHEFLTTDSIGIEGKGWIEVKLDVDLDGNTAEAFWRDLDDNAPGALTSWTSVSGGTLAYGQTLSAIQFAVHGSNTTPGTSARIDNINNPAHSVVPEPAALSLFGIGCLLGLSRRRR